MAVVARVFHDDFVCANWLHSVVEAVARTTGIAINAIQRMRMDYGARRPRTAVHGRRRRNHLQRLPRLRTKRTEVVRRGTTLGLVAADDPGTRDGILAQFHRS